MLVPEGTVKPPGELSPSAFVWRKENSVSIASNAVDLFFFLGQGSSHSESGIGFVQSLSSFKKKQTHAQALLEDLDFIVLTQRLAVAKKANPFNLGF